MAKSTDELIEFVLSEIALCGVKGAGSTEFRKFIQRFHEENQTQSTDRHSKAGRLTRMYYEKVWEWVLDCHDVRIVYRNEPRELSLTEFESLELQEEGSNGADYSAEQQSTPVDGTSTAANLVFSSLTKPSFRESLRKRLVAEGNASAKKTGAREREASHDSTLSDGNRTGTCLAGRQHRPQVYKGISVKQPIFDDVPPSTSAPRIYASQNRTWQAIAGHPVDFKRLSALQFELLSVIAAHGPNGIPQPDLVRVSGQDKRSVPSRTDELAKAGYIEKEPIATPGVRTSLCVHKRFVTAGHFLKEPSNLQDVFRNRTVIMSSLVSLLYGALSQVDFIPYRDLRERLGVTVQEWNTRGIRSSVRRLEETGFLERKRILKKSTRKNTIVIVRVLRAPTDEDVKYINYRRKTVRDTKDETLDEDDEEDGDDVMKDLDLDIEFDDIKAEDVRIPPQWSPDRLFPNLVYEAIEMAGAEGADAEKLREKTMGKFWKRPTESYISRLTDNWEISQPLHMRHLAIIRDTTITKEKKLVHYIYRTHGNFQKAVDAKAGDWQTVSREALKAASADKRGRPRKQHDEPTLNQFGFHDLSLNDFHLKRGSSTLTECIASINPRRRNGPRWDVALNEDLGVKKKPGRPLGVKDSQKRASTLAKGPKPKPKKTTTPKVQQDEHPATEPSSSDQLPASLAQQPTPTAHPPPSSRPPAPQPLSSKSTPVKAAKKTNRQLAIPLLSAAQREALNLPPRGRLGLHIENQIREHREKTGDPTSLPDVIYTEDKTGPKEKRPRKKSTETKLFTKAFRRKHGLPENGKLHQNVIDHFRQLEREGKLDELDTEENPAPLPSSPARRELERAAVGEGGEDAESVTLVGMERTSGDLEKPAEMRANSESDRPHPSSAKEFLTRTEHAVVNQHPHTDTNLRPARAGPFIDADTPSDTRFSPATETHVDADVSTGAVIPGTSVGSSISPQSHRTVPLGTKRKTCEPTGSRERLKRLRLTTDLSPPPQVQNTSQSPGGLVVSSVEIPDEAPGDAGVADKPATKASKTKQKTLEPMAQSVVDRFTQRSEPGLYINPYASRPVPRGRPKQAFLAVFKSTRLKEFEWFCPDPNAVKGRDTTSLDTSAKPRKKRVPKTPVTPMTSAMSEAPDTPVSTNVSENTYAPLLDQLREAASVSSNIMPVNGEATVQEKETTQRVQATGEEISRREQPPSNRDSPAVVDGVGDRGSPASRWVSPAPVRAHSGWNAVNSSTYRPVDRQVSVDSIIPASINGDVDGTSVRSTPFSGTPASDIERNVPAVPNMRALGYKRTPKQGAFTKRGVVLGRGYVWRLRTVIVMDIIERCGGFFPFNGEIVEPFYKIWDERAGPAMSRPDRTTITNTINRMVENPDHKIYKLAFRIPTVDRSTTIEKYLIARSDISATDPRIEELQNNVMKAYPKKFVPKEIRHLAGPDPIQHKHQEPEFDDSITMDGAIPSVSQKLNQRILDAAEQRKRMAKEKRPPLLLLPNQHSPSRGRIRHHRLETLGSGTSKAAKGPKRRLFLGEENVPPAQVRAGSPALSISSDDDTVAQSKGGRPVGAKKQRNTGTVSASSGSSTETGVQSGADLMDGIEPTGRRGSRDFINLVPSDFLPGAITGSSTALLSPRVQFYPNNGTFSTDFGIDMGSKARFQAVRRDQSLSTTTVGTEKQLEFIMEQPKGKKRKRVRFAGTQEDSPRKKKTKPEPLAPPTLVERLSGLTGDQDGPVYIGPRKKKNYRARPKPPGWKPASEPKVPTEKKVVEFLDPVETFKKLFCTLTIASCMSGEENVVDWSIVAKVYNSEAGFNLKKTKKLWLWMQEHMETQLRSLTDDFQSSFLEAYESGTVASIEDPETYDWAALVRWALRTCNYPGPSLPASQAALRDYVVEESEYKAFDRQAWTAKPVAHVIRAQWLVKYAYAAPLHSTTEQPEMTDAIRARSWIRSNTSTPQSVYDSTSAHDKFQTLGNTTLQTAVGDLVKEGMIRQRKLKRLLPGRNFNFTARLALKYRCAFDQHGFMDAVELKKSLDAAFAKSDPEQRAFTLSRTARDGAVMALMSLVNEGQVKIVPVLPPVNNKLRAPAPRLSVWGFMEGDYVHRKIDRKRLFWDIRAVPTSSYRFGNPLQSASEDSEPGDHTKWLPLPEPPLPGKHDATAALPIWSSMDGKHVTWPWWYRILNLVLQALMYQPGSSIAQVHTFCPTGTVELFEVELIIKWLVAVHAARECGQGTYMVTGGFWAAFGSELLGEDDDWFGEHVKRKKVSDVRQPWKIKFNLPSSARLAALERLRGEGHHGPDDEDLDEQDEEGTSSNAASRDHYGQRVIRKPAPLPMDEPAEETIATTDATVQQTRVGHDAAAQGAEQDVLMVDADANADAPGDVDADGDWDMDAEGEPDDE